MSDKYPFLDVPPPDHIVELAERYKSFCAAWNRELKRMSILEVRDLLTTNQRQFDKCLYLAETTGRCPKSAHFYEMVIHIVTEFLASRGEAE